MIEKFFLTGLNYRTAPLEMREKLALSGDELKNALQELKKIEGVVEVVCLSTCNRVEYYFFREGDIREKIHEFMKKRFGLSDRELKENFYSLEGEAVVKHLFLVAGSLDSMVLGEPQILNQVKIAYSEGVSAGTAGKNMSELFHYSFRVGKRVRSETDIGRIPTSVSHVAVEMAEKIFGELEDKVVAILGTGEMGTITARELISHGVSKLFIVSRTVGRAEELIEEIGKGLPMTYEEFEKKIPEFDLIVASTGSPNKILTKKTISNAVSLRKGNPVFIIDISVPRVVDGNVEEIEGVFLYDIDDLERIADKNRTLRKKEAEQGRRIVEEEVMRFIGRTREIDVNYTLGLIHNKFKEIIREELNEMIEEMRKKKHMSEEVIEGCINSLSKKLLHHPSNIIKKYAREGKFEEIKEILESFFGLKGEKL